MKRLVLFLIVGGFVGSHFFQSNQLAENQASEQTSNIKEVNSVPSVEKTTSSQVNNRHFLFLSLDKGNVKKVLITKIDNDSQTIEVASLSQENIKQFMNEKPTWIQDISKDDQFINEMGTNLGIPLNNIIVMEKQGFSNLFLEIFPNGMPLKLSDKMKSDLHVNENTDTYYVNSDEFVETMKVLKQHPEYEQEIHEMVVEAFYTQLSKPEVLLSMFNIIGDSEKYFFTDLTLSDLISIGIKVMKNPINDIQTLEVPMVQEQKV
jgi:predicted nucleic-acid-binding protein